MEWPPSRTVEVGSQAPLDELPHTVLNIHWGSSTSLLCRVVRSGGKSLQPCIFVYLFIVHGCGECTCVCLVHRCIHPACMRAGQKSPGVFLSCSLSYLLKQSISLNLELRISDKRSGKQTPGIQSPHQHTRVTAALPCPGFHVGVGESKLSFSYMCHADFTHSVISPTLPLGPSGDLFQSNTQYQLNPWQFTLTQNSNAHIFRWCHC